MAVVGLGVVYLGVALAKLLGVGTMVVVGAQTPDLVAELVLRAVGAGVRKGVGRPRSTPGLFYTAVLLRSLPRPNGPLILPHLLQWQDQQLGKK